ncbi:sigma factor-like helix-turn-helix DNA-binding protein [Actinomadura sp. DC4]|uniref:sigma factor-like helix-turn-helix DNA-binding protein n=1 Tax=Actinomadura sp. DC4 TaxID=3055069 RepID=UPI0025B15A4D|nr:sigma factor-like helix-turn-helix DNA-binding protein [Actinomadura sp. DC4]MDN3354895.1 sigma factor-like helix-turn-helix DNA-binding protein [Actinomadura sp. DC4]
MSSHPATEIPELAIEPTSEIEAARRADGPGLEELLARTRRRDLRAFEQIYTRVSAPVYGLVLRIAGDPALADAMTGEVFTQLWHDAGDYPPGTDPLCWIVARAHRHAVGMVRATRTPAERPRPPAEAPGGLSETQRRTMDLAYWDGFTYRQIAAVLNLPAEQVATLMADALDSLRSAAP